VKKIFLPTLETIHIQDYSLYPGNRNIVYNFVNGINLIFGGNGLGKTTFTYLIKYGLIGLYKKDYGLKQTYKQRAIEKREELPGDIFSKRMDPNVDYNNTAKVTLFFSINDKKFKVVRRLNEAVLEAVFVTEGSVEYSLSEKILAQSRYERLEEKEKQICLQFKYEKAVADASNFNSFDDLIFFVNEILFFDENHKTILWEEDNEGIQERFSSKYLVDTKLDLQREEAIRKAKYYNSLSRHKSEDIRVIKQLIDSIIRAKEKKELPIETLLVEISRIKGLYDKSRLKLENIYNEQKKITDDIRILNNNKNILSIELKKIGIRLKNIEKDLFKEVWGKLNPKYKLFYDNIKLNHSCPMCNQQFPSDKYQRVIDVDNFCLLCEQDLPVHVGSDKHYQALLDRSKSLAVESQKIDVEVDKLQDRIEALDKEYKGVQKKLFEYETKLRQLEHILNTDTDIKDDKSFELRTMMAQIAKLEVEKNNYADLSRQEEIKRKEVSDQIEIENEKITQNISQIFSNFAEKFLGVKCFLTYDDFKDNKGKRYLPVINGTVRYTSQELSESQRFFIDHSYRMSLLHLFYQTPTFFVCETPDSSLDLSYEENVANVFIHFLNQPSALIITSNLNNSHFLDYIITKNVEINYLSLLDIGRSSPIQRANPQLKKLLERLTSKLNQKVNGTGRNN